MERGSAPSAANAERAPDLTLPVDRELTDEECDALLNLIFGDPSAPRPRGSMRYPNRMAGSYVRKG